MVSGINRTLIPRYYRSIFEGGVTDLRYELRHPKESFHNTSITMDIDQCTIVTLHGKPMFTKVSQEMNVQGIWYLRLLRNVPHPRPLSRAVRNILRQ